MANPYGSITRDKIIKPKTSTPLATDGRELLGTPNVSQSTGSGPAPQVPTSQGLYGGGGQLPKKREVATTANPVLVATPAPKEETVITPKYGEVQGLDQEGLQDYIDMLSVKQSRGQQISEQEQLNLMKANRMLTTQQQEKVNPFTGAIETAETRRDSELERIQGQADEQFNITQQEIQERSQRRIDEERKAGADTLQASAQQLAFLDSVALHSLLNNNERYKKQ